MLGPLLDLCTQQGCQSHAVSNPFGVGGELRINPGFIKCQHAAKGPELSIIPARHNDIAITGCKCLVGRNIGMRIPQSRRRVSRGEIVHRLVCQHARHAIKKRDINALTQPADMAFCKGRLDANYTVQTRKNIGKGHTDLLGRTIGFTC